MARLSSPRLAPPGPEGIVCDERNAAEGSVAVIAAAKLTGVDTLHLTHGLGIAGTQAAGVREVFGECLGE